MKLLSPQQGVYFAFCLYALSLGAIFPRLGDIQLQMGIGQDTLGMAIIGAAFGCQLSLLTAGQVLRLVGFRPVMVAGIVVISSGEFLASTATGPWGFFGWLFFAGLAIGVLEVALNVEADRVEHVISRRIMNRSHAFWSLGFFFAGLLGAVVAQAGIEVSVHLAGMLIFLCLATFVLVYAHKPAPAKPDEAGQNVRFARPTRPILMLVGLTLPAMLLEGAGIDWSVIFMRDEFATPPFVNGMALALGALSQFVVRFFADRQVERFGPQTIARWSIIALGLGVIMVAFAPTPAMALIGFVLLGAGNAAIFPLAVSAAARRTDRSPAVNVAALSQLTFVVFFLAPPLLGFIAENVGIRWSFGLVFPLVVMGWFSLRSLHLNR
jgi:MFS family permease